MRHKSNSDLNTALFMRRTKCINYYNAHNEKIVPKIPYGVSASMRVAEIIVIFEDGVL